MQDKNELLSQMADDLDAIPSDDKNKALASRAKELVELDEMIDCLEETVKDLKKQRYELQTKTLPDIMNETGANSIGVGDVTVVMSRKVHANISKDWDDARKARAFEHLRELGAADLIKNTLSVAAGKKSDDKMRMLVQRVTQILAEMELEASVKLEPAVPWNTLTAFVKSELKNSDLVIDLAAIGATDVQFVEIKRN